MREIKFRGWSIYDEKWVYGYLTVKATKRDLEKHYFIYSESGMSGWRVDPESVGQRILHWKNGEEFYEGDIVKCISDDGEFVDLHEIKWISHFIINGEIEVVGNMFENKELLNV